MLLMLGTIFGGPSLKVMNPDPEIPLFLHLQFPLHVISGLPEISLIMIFTKVNSSGPQYAGKTHSYIIPGVLKPVSLQQYIYQFIHDNHYVDHIRITHSVFSGVLTGSLVESNDS